MFLLTLKITYSRNDNLKWENYINYKVKIYSDSLNGLSGGGGCAGQASGPTDQEMTSLEVQQWTQFKPALTVITGVNVRGGGTGGALFWLQGNWLASVL